MNRPNKENYLIYDEGCNYSTGFAINDYLEDIEKYCDELESKLKGLTGDYEAQADILYETKQELERYKKALDNACKLIEIHCVECPSSKVFNEQSYSKECVSCWKKHLLEESEKQ